MSHITCECTQKCYNAHNNALNAPNNALSDVIVDYMCTIDPFCAHTWRRWPSEMFAMQSAQHARVPPWLRRHAQHLRPPTGMRLVRSDVTTVRGVHVVFALTTLETRADLRRHAANKSQARVGICTWCGRPVTLADELCDPPHVSAQTGNAKHW